MSPRLIAGVAGTDRRCRRCAVAFPEGKPKYTSFGAFLVTGLFMTLEGIARIDVSKSYVTF